MNGHRRNEMKRKATIHELIRNISMELLEFVREEEPSFSDGWVPAAHIKQKLDLNFPAVPRENKQYGEKGWLFATIARILEDEGKLKYKKIGGRAFYRSPQGS